MSTTIPFPIFEKGLPLRVDDLNKLFDYLDGEARLARLALTGAGIFNGLDVSWDKDSKLLTIGKGAGVTSQGYLLQLDKDLKFLDIAVKAKPVQVPRSAFIGLNSWTGAKDGDETVMDAYELFSDGDPRLNALTPAPKPPPQTRGVNETEQGLPSGNFVLAALLYRNSTDRSGCTTCGKGKDGSVDVRFLLLKENDWETKILHSDLTRPKRSVLFPYLQRFGASGDCSANFTYAVSAGFNEQYETIVAASNVVLQDALNQLLTELPLFFGKELVKDADGVIGDWKKRVLVNGQYDYDYAKHLIRAYDELVERDFARSLSGLPEPPSFPKYLGLNGLKKTDSGIEIWNPDNVRPPFYRASAVGDGQTDETRFLYQRLIEMLKPENLKFQRDLANNPSRLRITPSRAGAAPLGDRAIPFYFDGAKMRPFWDFSKKSAGRQNSIAAYDRASEKPFDQPLLYQGAFDDADFYRVEGHVGQNLKTVLETLVGPDAQPSGLRTCLNLPFSVAVVELRSSDAPPNARYPSLEEFAKKNPGLEHQGGAPRGGTMVLVVESAATAAAAAEAAGAAAANPAAPAKPAAIEERAILLDDLSNYNVVADFSLPYRAAETPRALPTAIFTEKSRTRLTDTRQITGFDIVFDNSSVNAKSYEWRIDGKSASTEQNPTLPFLFDDMALEVRDFIVALVAYGEEKQKGEIDVEEITVSIRRYIVKADFNFADGDGSFFNEDNDDAHPFLLPVDEPGVAVNFKNLSEHGVRYKWSLFLNDVLVSNRDFVNPLETREIGEGFKVVLSEGAYKVRLAAFDSAGDEASVCDKFITVTINSGDGQINEPVPSGQTAVPSGGAAVLSGDAPAPAVVRSFDAAPPPVTALTAAQNQERRRRFFLQRIVAETEGEPALAGLAPYQNVLSFISEMDKAKAEFDRDVSFSKSFSKTDQFDNSFKNNALELINDIVFQAGVPVDAYRSILKNFVFFYLDKLVALQPDGLAPSTSAMLTDVLAEITAEKSFENDSLADFFVKWNERMVKTSQNAVVVEQLSAMFK